MADELLVLVLFAHGIGSAEANQQQCTTAERSILVVLQAMLARKTGHTTAAHFLLVAAIAVEEAALSISTNGQAKN